MKTYKLMMTNKWSVRQMLRNRFVKNVSTVMSGTVLAQLITVLAAPLLSRIFTSEDMGIFSLYMSITGIISLISALKYEMAILLPKDDEEASHLFILSCLVVVMVSLLTLVLILVFGEEIVTSTGVPQLQSSLIWIPFTVLMTGIYQSLQFWSTRRKMFRRTAVSQVFRSSAVTSTQIGSGSIGFGATGLITGQVAGQMIACAMIGVQTFRDEPSLFRIRVTMEKLRKWARKYADFPKYSTPQTLANALSQNLPIFLLAHYYGAEIVGLYAIALRLLQLPITLISQSVRQVFLQKASSAEHDGARLHAMLKKLTLMLAAVAVLPAIVIIIFAPVIFEVILGAEWMGAGEYARWIILWLFFSFINPPSVVMTTILGLQKMLLFYECSLLLFRFGALWIGGMYFSAETSIGIYSVTGVVFNLFLIAYMFRVSKNRARKYSH